MPIPNNVISLAEFRNRANSRKAQADREAQECNIRAQDHFCWWCGEFAETLIVKYWHGFCTDKCWKEYRDSRLRRP